VVAGSRPSKCFGPRVRSQSIISMWSNRFPTCIKRESCAREAGLAGGPSVEAVRSPVGIVPVFRDVSTTFSAGSSDLEAALDLPLYNPRREARTRAKPGRDARLLGTPQDVAYLAPTGRCVPRQLDLVESARKTESG